MLTFTLATDVNGSTIPTPNTAGFARAHGYDEYGNPTGPTMGNPHEPALGYRGELQTGDTVHLRARTYHPHTGTFATPDPLDGLSGRPTETNPYHYASNTPIERVDPQGLRDNDSDVRGPGSHRPLIHVFRIPPYRSAFISDIDRRTGRVRINLFIPTAKVCVGGLCFEGDDRSFNSSARGQDSRASIDLDFRTGRGELYISYSCRLGPTFDCHDPLELGRSPSPGQNFFRFLRRPTGDIYIDYSIWNSAFPGANSSMAVGCPIDGTFHLRTVDLEGRVAIGGVFDAYPSVEAYQFGASGTRTLLNQRAIDHWHLCA